MTGQEKEYLRGLENVKEALNSTLSGGLLPELVQKWQASGPNTAKFVTKHPQLWHECLQAWKPALVPTKEGNWRINLVANAEAPGSAGARHKAFVLFNSLLANPLWSKLGGPCSRCGQYFVTTRERSRKTARTYCSRECAWRSTAVEFSAKKRDAAREEKLVRAREAIKTLKRPAAEWKRDVAAATGIDLRFLTRAVSAGDLKEPK